ncbi:MAG: 4-hydroxy-tetrahydrodipicolinate synthase [Candidatus Lokiarchaeota archaeon]|nr:4-hydroxy-tetrahydrodipicolinate synthase [Candidatus Lokiarchaeota archaeon]MBD3201422.1 4-hydroxy-tetrahydrodipicolinate synthase [Candidatus Lokiarchaeota archaeon]
MSKFEFRPKGVMPAMVTPFNKDESINEEYTKNLVNFLIDEGVTGLVPCGTTGEFVNMTYEERLKIIEIVVDETNGRVPVIAGTGETSTREVIRATNAATDIGADAAIVVTPYYLKPGAKGLYEHYYRITEETDIPLVLYNIPVCTGVNLPWTVVEDLAEIESIVAIKDSSGDYKYFSALLEKVSDKISVLIGWDENVLGALAGGAAGMILGSANVIPSIWLKLYNLIKENKLKEAQTLQKSIQKFARILIGTGAIGAKACLNMMNIDVGITRSPIIMGDALPFELRDELRVELEKLNLISKEKIEFKLNEKELSSRFYSVGVTPELIDNFNLKVGESLVGEGAELAHIDLLIGKKDGPVGNAYARSLTLAIEDKEALQVILEPNMQVKPASVMIPTVKVSSLRHASLLYGPAQAAIGKAIVQCVEDGILPSELSEEIVLIVNVFVHPTASRRKRVFINNYKATRNAIRKAMENQPGIDENLENKENARHPLRNDP